jgi:molybdopterin-synthase adenylyltransferase
MDPAQREADQRIYGVDRAALAGTGPMVVSINGVVASLAVTEFICHVTGLRQPAGKLTYHAHQGVVRRGNDQPPADCYYCAGVWGSKA